MGTRARAHACERAGVCCLQTGRVNRRGTWHTGKGVEQCASRRGGTAQGQRQLAAPHPPPARQGARPDGSTHIWFAGLLGQGVNGIPVQVRAVCGMSVAAPQQDTVRSTVSVGFFAP